MTRTWDQYIPAFFLTKVHAGLIYCLFFFFYKHCSLNGTEIYMTKKEKKKEEEEGKKKMIHAQSYNSWRSNFTTWKLRYIITIHSDISISFFLIPFIFFFYEEYITFFVTQQYKCCIVVMMGLGLRMLKFVV
jgi:hypothetical protein